MSKKTPDRPRPTVIKTGQLKTLSPSVAASIRKLAAIARARIDSEADRHDHDHPTEDTP